MPGQSTHLVQSPIDLNHGVRIASHLESTRWPNELTDGSVAGSGNGTLVPKVNVSETDGAVEVEAEFPGFESKDIEVTLQQHSLDYRGE